MTELSNDLDVLLEQDRADRGGTSEAGEPSEAVTAALASVQKSTEKLAAEQARYEIQFREDTRGTRRSPPPACRTLTITTDAGVDAPGPSLSVSDTDRDAGVGG